MAACCDEIAVWTQCQAMDFLVSWDANLLNRRCIFDGPERNRRIACGAAGEMIAIGRHGDEEKIVIPIDAGRVGGECSDTLPSLWDSLPNFDRSLVIFRNQ